MSNPAQEEVDRLFSQHEHHESHPEDRQTASEDIEDDNVGRKTIRQGGSHTSDDEFTDDNYNDHEHDRKNAGSSHVIPTTKQYSNTGVKGVITDAQEYERAKYYANKPRFVPDTGTRVPNGTSQQPKPVTYQDDSDEDVDTLLSDPDAESFLSQWRQKRMAELQAQSEFQTHSTGSSISVSASTDINRLAPSGVLTNLSADSYLQLIDMAPSSISIVILIFDPLLIASLDLEDEMKMLAYKCSGRGQVRFCKLHNRIADMRDFSVPGVLIYRSGEVLVVYNDFDDVSLEGMLRRDGVLAAF